MKLTVTTAILGILLFSCSQQTQKEPVNKDFQITGTWTLKQYKDVDGENPDAWSTYDEGIIYEKYITPSHFTWIQYNKTSNKLIGAGGGTYSFDGNQYVENIDFFFPPGSNELGQSIPFEFGYKDGQWYHKGYAKVIEMDIETGDMIQVDSTKIEEIWERSMATINDEQPELYGSWNLDSYREDSTDESRLEYPEFIKYMKLITPTHFVWVQYDTEGNKVYGLGAGTYNFENGKYVENIAAIYPNGRQQQDTQVKFDMEMSDDSWKHVGFVIMKNENKAGEEVREEVYVDERWSKYNGAM